jgi:hypothetical protein
MGKLVLRKIVLRNMIDPVWAPLVKREAMKAYAEWRYSSKQNLLPEHRYIR